MNNFTQLHFHTDYSIRDGFVQIPSLVKFAVDNDIPAISITDHGNMNGSLKLYFEAKKANIKPIIGCELYACKDREKKLSQDSTQKLERDHLILLAKNHEGFMNLIKITSNAWLNGYNKGFPVSDYDFIYNNSKGLICSTACAIGRLSKNIQEDNMKEANSFLYDLKSVFGDDLYTELIFINFKGQDKLNAELAKLALKHKVKTIVTSDCHYVYKDDYKIHELVLLLANKNTMSDLKSGKAWKFDADNLYFKTKDEMLQEYDKYFKKFIDKKILDNSFYGISEIIDKVENFDIDASLKFPKIYEGKSPIRDYVEALCYRKLRSLGKQSDEEYIKRLDYELDILKSKDFLDYFLILKDTVDFARNKSVNSVGPARGSSAGSIIAFLLGITQVDPMKWKLLFERFLNPYRNDVPDIDMDFHPAMRDEVKQHIFEKYPGKAVSIGAFGKLRFRACIQDIARTLEIPPSEFFPITKKITSDADEMTLEEAMEVFPFLKTFIKKYPQIKTYFDKIHGSIRNVSKHAAGVIVSNKELKNHIPLIRSGEDAVTGWTEGNEKELTKIGFLKIDILGLTAISILKDTVELIKQNKNEEIVLTDIPFDDKRVFRVCNKLNLSGIFQFDTSIAKKLIKEIQPESVLELSNISSLMRPGPLRMGMNTVYINRKFGHEEFVIPDGLEDVLGESYGVILYQEQIMKICEILGGFTLYEADNIRKLLLKVNDEVLLNKYKGMFIKKASEQIGRDSSEILWETIEHYAAYGFNKCHSISYAIISYWEMWLKFYYPLEFYCALLMNTNTNDKGKESYEIVHIINEALNYGIEIMPPDINVSNECFSIKNDKIYFGIRDIKFVSNSAGEIIQHRPYTSIKDMQMKVNKRKVNKRVVEALSGAGAFDNVEDEILSSKETELEFLNVNLKYRKAIKVDGYNSISSFKGSGHYFGTILGVKVIKTKKLDDMAFINFYESDVRMICWPQEYEEYKSFLKQNDVLKFKCYEKGDSVIIDRCFEN